ncbi:MAG TPA: tRNA adenosine deaminase-associated protein [Pilimelia sp.]|nr:tRNA adenosine deaminase-associated protein [Pilimelia sp.]
MSYFAAAAVRGPDGWSASEVDLAGVADVDEVADRLRDVDPDAELSLLFVESDDMYLAILRLDEGEDLRVFGSDSAFAAENRLGALLLSDVGTPAVEAEVIEVIEPVEPAAPADDDEPEQPVAAPDADPVGDADILADLKVPGHRLLELCGHDGLLPADVTAELSQALGFGDEMEELREA